MHKFGIRTIKIEKTFLQIINLVFIHYADNANMIKHNKSTIKSCNFLK